MKTHIKESMVPCVCYPSILESSTKWITRTTHCSVAQSWVTNLYWRNWLQIGRVGHFIMALPIPKMRTLLTQVTHTHTLLHCYTDLYNITHTYAYTLRKDYRKLYTLVEVAFNFCQCWHVMLLLYYRICSNFFVLYHSLLNIFIRDLCFLDLPYYSNFIFT